MSLLSTDITKVKRLSLKEVKLPTPELRVEPITPILVERPPSDEDILYSRLVIINPFLEELVETLDLVSNKTGERIRRVEDIKAPQEPDKLKVISLAQKIIKGENSYTTNEIKQIIKEATNVSQERAENGFNLILQAGAIDTTPTGKYYLATSTPF